MKLAKTLTIGSKGFGLVDDDVWLEANAAGRATFTVDTEGQDLKPFQAVALDIGYTQHDHQSRVFLGYIQDVTLKGGRQAVLFCREMAGVLNHTAPISLRHPTLNNVLATLNEKSGLNFAVPDKPYADTRIPHFASVGNGYLALKHIGIVFKISDFFWQQQADGTVFVGSWDDSPWPDREVELPDEWFSDQFAKTAQVAAVPSLRPGAVLNGQRVRSVRLAGNFMGVEWV